MKMLVGKIALGVFLGNLMTGLVAFKVYEIEMRFQKAQYEVGR